MANKDIDLDVLDDMFDFDDVHDDRDISECEFSNNDIAIVGLSIRAGRCDNADELWNALKNGEDMITDIPLKRKKDAESFEKFLNKDAFEFTKKSYMKQIDMFSPSFFNIPPKDAALIDPAQRMMLETAWKAIEDAGEAGSRLKNSQTGVFIGYSAQDHSYSNILSEATPEFSDRTVAGRVNSMIASRISYYLDLKGPAVMIDTACSSSLVAVHLACSSLHSGECSMAIVGGVKYYLLPDSQGGEISVESESGRTKTFNIDSDGTGAGEGVAAIILKPLSRAQKDKNHIYAIIKGSAINQDGASVGITAPNAASQEEVILEAWKSANIDPEKVSYIEAHGTATKLGDPIEASGIERAFRRYTNKKQFCAIGSIKTNLGHLDCAAGLVGLIKCLLALKHKELPPMLHFYSPNAKINFIESPVYINDRLISWEADGLRICGVSSFGISGTNCHVILQEYNEQSISASDKKNMILPISARDEDELKEVVELLKKDIRLNSEQIKNLIYTYAVSKSNMRCRYAAIIKDILDIENIEIKELPEQLIEQSVDELIIKIKESDFNDISSMEKLCSLYVNGSDVNWRALYSEENVIIVPVSGYPLKEERCWTEPVVHEKQNFIKKLSHPLIENCVVSSPQVSIYSVVLSEFTHSEVREHIIGDKNVLAGTVYLEMIRCAASDMFESDKIQIDNLIFMSPMIFEKNQLREVNVIFYQEGTSSYLATVQSKASDDDWTIHVQANVSIFDEAIENIDYNELYERIKSVQREAIATKVEQLVKTGPRWQPECKMILGNDELLFKAKLKEEYAKEQSAYCIFPAILDASVNCCSIFNNDIFCLPFYYGSFRIYKPMPSVLYSHVVRKPVSNNSNSEIFTFDVVMFDESGEVVATVTEYAMKRVDEEQQQKFFNPEEYLLHTIEWKEDQIVFNNTHSKNEDKPVMLIKYIDSYNKKLYNTIKNKYKNIYELVFCDWTMKDSNAVFYSSPDDKNRISTIVNRLDENGISKIVFLYPVNVDQNNLKYLYNWINSVIRGFWNVTFALANNKRFDDVTIEIVAHSQNENISPFVNALIGMGRSLLFEYSRLKYRAIVYSEDTDPQIVVNEMLNNNSNYMTFLKHGNRYVPQMVGLKYDEAENTSFKVISGGTYLITGGTNGIGLLIAKKLAESEQNINLVLLSRSGALPKELWKKAIDNEQTKELYTNLCELSDKVKSVKIIKCDISADDAVEKITSEIDELTGIIHSAGLPGGGFVIKSKWDDFYNVLKPKLYGSCNIIDIAKQKSPDFIVLFSSYSTVLTVPGQSDYIAANSYVDSLAYYSDEGLNSKIKVINWGGWKETGMAKRNGIDMSSSPIEFMNNEDGWNMFVQAMSVKPSRILAGKLNFNAVVDSIDDFNRIINFDKNITEQINKAISVRKKHVSTNKSYDIIVKEKGSPLTETETKIAQAWAKVLGLSEVNYNSKFLEIGGDSMSAMYLQKEISNIYPNTMDITDVFVYSSIPEMAKLIDEKLNKPVKHKKEVKEKNEQMMALLEKLAAGEINVDDVESII